MHRTMIIAIVAMFGGAIQSLHADDADTLDRRIEGEQRANRAAAKGLDIDYQLCAAVVIADAIKNLASTDTVYLSFMARTPLRRLSRYCAHGRYLCIPDRLSLSAKAHHGIQASGITMSGQYCPVPPMSTQQS